MYLFYPDQSFFPRETFIVLAFLLSEILWIVLFLVVTDFYLDAWVVTNQRLIFVEVHGLFSRTVNSVDYRNVQDISVGIHGFFATLLNFGDIAIQSAGTHGNFLFRQVPKPDSVKGQILTVKNERLLAIHSLDSRG